ncbi:hypothetical protein VOLCADRAFT_98055 [Volvox carteri f. nagariensis]|uniref:Uncharacterized protein n=1 Tax=Volvox carteri f. nagariensis TaxID=3068 RepID=D8UEB7_VOLCA|nr:uncharacterized protein VOLCADRAFT_98055 [Volvox carteri f. nagariensis]XP_002959513.1 uncharacterized protein VOLCADRAFT_100995 [Volvox carteri f. nagariensis]EFJ39424.1 hypothetical protein VOLCADRAFT_100995 [Volvox carteri f. nagariensis]EFJ41976.1 hypothetical protein VOLCADRAFT_98055 [Volvox carteri f. nagariensis]|eukprot:XP_002957013.1 hypothetical protein VOLCADRAFT_98055 [Volvox carteri f. nagariensis]
MQLSQGFKALLRQSALAQPAQQQLGTCAAAARKNSISSSATSGSSQEGESTEGQAPMPNFNSASGTEDPRDVAARVGRTTGSGTGPVELKSWDAREGGGGTENDNECPGGYSGPQEQLASGGAAGQTEGRRVLQPDVQAASGGSSRQGGSSSCDDQDRRADAAAAATAGPLGGRMVAPAEAPSQGEDLPPGHDGSGSTLKSPADQADA